MLQNFTVKFQNAAEPSQCVAWLDALQGTLQWSKCEAMMVKNQSINGELEYLDSMLDKADYKVQQTRD